MLFWTILKVALKSLFANKLRSFLAMLGVIIGVAAVISMLALGAGAQKQITERISSMGTDLLVVRPGHRHGPGGVVSSSRQELTLDDARSILSDVPGVLQVAPVVQGSAQIKYYNKNAPTAIVGTSITYFPVRNFEVERGRPFTEGEAANSVRVAVIGTTAAENLFDQQDPLGETIKIKGMRFMVIGVLKSKGDQGWYNPDDQVIIPYTIAMKQLLGQSTLREIDVQVQKGADHETVREGITQLLRKRYRLSGDEDDDYRVRSQEEMLETMSGITRTFTILLAGIASISLLVGGIGIMNIMLVTVTERTREIGIRKAVGARSRDILRQFIIESIIMSGVGGLIGVGLGVGIARIIGQTSEHFSTSVTLSSILLSLSFSAAVGIFFGYYPARCAAKLDPIESLRYE